MKNNISDIIKDIGDNPNREGLIKTPERVIKSWEELYSGYNKNIDKIFTVFDSDGYDEMIICKDIEFYSMCEHHMLPFYGKIHIGYIPDGKIIGLSKLARLANIFARRLQVQERLTNQIAEILMKKLQPLGVGVIVEGKHLCMMSRGIQKQNSSMITSSMFGVLKTKPEARAEFMRLIK